jgi:N-dimethylarginine dimethylaminohydrolase
MMPAFNEYSPLKRVALRTPKAAFKDDARIDAEWKKLNYHSRPDLAGAVREYDEFSDVLAKAGAELITLPDAPGLTLDSLYVRDSLIVTPKGIVLAHMGKPARRAEPAANAAALGLPIAGEIKAPGMIEGGDLVWLDEKTLLVGVGYRTNAYAVQQLQAILPQVAIHAFDLPHFKGRSDVFHLMSVLSPLDADLACVYLPLMPVRLVELLEQRGIAFAEVPQNEFDSMGCNVLALAPRHVVMVSGNPGTAEAMRATGCKVEILEANEISRKGEGGPTCLTRPLVRG